MAELIKSKYREAFEHIVNCDREDNHASNLSDAYRNDLSALLELINKYEEQPTTTESEIRAKAYQRFVDKAWEVLGSEDADIYARETIMEIAEQLKGE